MDNNRSLTQIRAAEKTSHIEVYSNKKLYQAGNWLSKPTKTVMDIIPLFNKYLELHVLDLGCGVGRNCIPIAQEYKKINCLIESVDILDYAIEKLSIYCKQYEVDKIINGIVSPIESYIISKNYYDLIMSVSALEHINSKESFTNKLFEICQGIRKNGIVCLIINTNVKEVDIQTKEVLPPQFEVDLSSDELKEIIQQFFESWDTLKLTQVEQHYNIPRGQRNVFLTTDVVTYVGRRCM